MPQPIGRDLEDTREKLIAWLATRLPAAENISVDNLRGPSDTGFSSDTLMFDLGRREAGEDRREPLVVRLAPDNDCPIFPTYDVALQFRIMDALAKTPVPVPGMRWLEEDASLLGAPFYVMDRVEGRVPNDTPPYHTGGWVYELSPEGRTELWWSGLDAMANIHRLDVDGPGFEFVPRPTGGRSPIEHQLDYWQRYVAWGLAEPVPILEQAGAWLAERAPRDEPRGLCWGDSRLANQIFDGLQCVAVIDWEMLFVGNPEADLGWWITLDRCFSEGIGAERLAGLPGREASIARWQERVGREASLIRYYEVFAAFRFASIMARIGVQMKHYELLPADHPWSSNNLASHTLTRLLEEVG